MVYTNKYFVVVRAYGRKKTYGFMRKKDADWFRKKTIKNKGVKATLTKLY